MNILVRKLNYLKKFKVDDDKIGFVIALQFLLVIFKYVLIQVVPGLYIYNDIANIILGLFLISIYLWILPIIYKKNLRFTIITLILVSISFLFTFMLFPANAPYIYEYLPRIIFASIFLLIVVTTLKDTQPLLKYLVKFSYPMIILCFIFFGATAILGPVGTFDRDYNMSISYYCLFPTTILLYDYLQNKNKINLIFVLLGVIVIIALGSRAPLLCIAIFLVLYFSKNIKQKKVFITFSILCISTIIVMIYKNTILLFINNLLYSLGISSRTLLFLLEGSMGSITGRDPIYKMILESIKLNPLIGYGIRGDAVILGGAYTHNLVLEILVSFGVVLGSILLIFLICIWIKGIFFTKDKHLFGLILIVFSNSIPKLMFSNSFWIDEKFWMLLGLCILSLKKDYSRSKLQYLTNK